MGRNKNKQKRNSVVVCDDGENENGLAPLMAPETTEQLGGKKTSRLYYVDWCRSIGIHVVLLEHCINSVETATGERYINQNWLEKKDSYFRFLLQFGVPLFFFLSGMSVTYINTEAPNAFLKYTMDKLFRIIAPLIAAIFVFLIPRHYFGQTWDPIGRLDNETRQEWDFLKFVPGILAEDFLTKLGPLWFLPCIFIVMVMNYPLIKFSRRRKRLESLDQEDLKLVLGQLFLVLFCWNGFTSMFVEEPLYVSKTLPASFMLSFWYLVFFGAQYFMAQNLCSSVWVISIMTIGIFATISQNYFHQTGSVDLTMFDVCIMHNYHMLFFAQGILYNVWQEQLALATGKLKMTGFLPLWVMVNIFTYGLFVAGQHSNTGFYFVYPMYIYAVDNAFFVIGTWQTIYALLYIYEMQINDVFNEKWYSLVTRSSMFVYIAHDFWQTAIISSLVYNNVSTYNKEKVLVKEGGLPIFWALFIVFIGSECLVIANFLLFEKCMKSKKKQESS